MSYKKAIAFNSSLDTEALKEMRDLSRNFLRLDLAYLVAIGSIFTALKMGKHEILNSAAASQEIIYAFLFVLVSDLSVEYVLLNEWITSRQVGAPRMNAKFVKFLGCCLQPLVHFIFIFGILTGIAAYGEGRKRAIDTYESYGRLQLGLDEFIRKNGRLPKDFDELKKLEPRVKAPLKFLKDEQIQLVPIGERSYRLTIFSHGSEQDDEVITPTAKVYELNHTIEEARRIHPND